MTRFIERYWAACVLMVLALFFNGLHWYLEVAIAPEQGTSAYWLNTTVENLQSEMWQVVAAAFVFQHWKWEDSPEANEDAPNSRGMLAVPGAVIVLFLILLAVVIP